MKTLIDGILAIAFGMLMFLAVVSAVVIIFTTDSQMLLRYDLQQLILPFITMIFLGMGALYGASRMIEEGLDDISEWKFEKEGL